MQTASPSASSASFIIIVTSTYVLQPAPPTTEAVPDPLVGKEPVPAKKLEDHNLGLRKLTCPQRI